MILTLELTLIFGALLALGVWGIASGIRQSRSQSRQSVSPQQLSALAQPYRRVLGEAVAIGEDVAMQAKTAPSSLQQELSDLAFRIDHLIQRALPRAKHGTSLASYLLELKPDEAQYAKTKQAAQTVEGELEQFLDTLKTLRAKVYQILTDANQLGADSYLGKDLEDALIDVAALEAAFSESTES